MFDGLNPYPDYQKTGETWLGAVPAHWNFLPNRAVFEEIKDQGHSAEPMLSVTISRGVIQQADLLSDTSKKDSSNLDRSKYKLVQPGDIAYNKMRAWQGAVGASKHRGIISPAYVVQRLRAEGNPEYFHHLFRTPGFAKEAERWSYGITSDMWSLRPEHFKTIYTCVPPPAEQAVIVRFLGAVDRKVNRFIRAKRRLIEVLTEQKQAIITHAVTRGLNPAAPLKPSGIDWLGDVPEHWSVLRLRNLVSQVTSGSRGWSRYMADTGPLFIRIGNLTRGSLELDMSDAARLQLPKDASEVHRTRAQANDILVSITAYIGSFAVVPEGIEEAYVSQHVALCRPRPTVHNARWVGYVLLSPIGQAHGKFSLNGGTKDGLSLDDVKNHPVLMPPPSEQDRIVAWIESESAQLNASIAAIKGEIDLIREYRTRLVADVVTGKVDVRAAAAALPPDEEPVPMEDAVPEIESAEGEDELAEGAIEETADVAD